MYTTHDYTFLSCNGLHTHGAHASGIQSNTTDTQTPTNDIQSSIGDTQSPVCDTHSSITDTQSPVCDTFSSIADTQNPSGWDTQTTIADTRANPLSLHTITNMKGGMNVVFDGYSYTMREKTDRHIRWRCAKRCRQSSQTCKATLTTTLDMKTATNVLGQHNHPRSSISGMAPVDGLIPSTEPLLEQIKTRKGRIALKHDCHTYVMKRKKQSISCMAMSKLKVPCQNYYN